MTSEFRHGHGDLKGEGENKENLEKSLFVMFLKWGVRNVWRTSVLGVNLPQSGSSSQPQICIIDRADIKD